MSSSPQYTPVPNNKVPLPPVTAERYSTVCRFCNVSCGYDVFVFPVGQEGGPAAGQNAVVYNTVDKVTNRNLQNYQADYTNVLQALSANSGTPWIGEGMVSKTVKYNPNTKTWDEVYILEVPSPECPNNMGNYSTRGGRNAQRIWSPFTDNANGSAVYQSRIKTPLLRWNGTLQPVGWSYAIEVAAQILYYYLTNETSDYPIGPAATQVLAYRSDHGGGQGGAYMSNLASGLLLHMGLATPFVRLHNRMAFTSEQAAQAEATNGGGLNVESFEDIRVTDVMVMAGINEYATSTVNLIQHIFDNLRGATQSEKAQWFDQGEPTPPGMAIIVEVRPSETVHAVAAAVGCTAEQAMNGTCNVGKSQEGLPQVLAVIINPGTDAELFNAVAAYIYYTYGSTTVQNFINMYQQAQQKSNNVFQFNSTNYQYYLQYLQSKSLSDWLSEASQITGVSQNIIQMMGDMLAKPKTNSSGQTFYKRVAIDYEKGLIWSSNYTAIYSLANLAIITGAYSGRPGSGLSRDFGHQAGAAFPVPPPPPWYPNIGLSLNQGREVWIPMSEYVPQQLQKQGTPVNGSNIAEFIKNFYSQYTSSQVPLIHQYNPVVDYLIYSGYGKVLWAFTVNAYKQTMSAAKFAETVNHRSQLLQECVENTLSAGVPSSSSSSITSSPPYYNVNDVSSTNPGLPDPDTYAQAVISCLSGSNSQPGALFVVGSDSYLTQNSLFETAAHLLLPSAINNGEIYDVRISGHGRRLRLVEPFHSPPGMAMPDPWIYSMIAYRIYQLLQQNGMGNSPQAQRIYKAFNTLWTSLTNNMTQNSQPLSLIPEFSEFYYDYDWFNIASDIWDYYIANNETNFSWWPYGFAISYFGPGFNQVKLDDLRQARTVGIVSPILGKTTNPDGSFTLWGLPNYADPGVQGAVNGQFRVEAVTINPNQAVTVGNTQLPLITREIKYISINDLQSMFGYDYNTLMKYVMSGLNPFPIPYVGVFGYSAQLQQKYKYLVNNGRWNTIWQSGFTDHQVAEIFQRLPYPIIAVSQQDAQNEGWNNGDLLKVYNDWGSITAVAWISNTVLPGQVFLAMSFPTSPGANQVTSPTVDPVTANEAAKWTWANIQKIGTLPEDMKQQLTLAPVQFNVPSSSS